MDEKYKACIVEKGMLFLNRETCILAADHLSFFFIISIFEELMT